LQTAPDRVAARRLLTQIYLESGRGERALGTALPLVDEGVAPDARNALVVGLAYLQNGNLKKAEELFAIAHKLDPGDPGSRTALAAAHLQGGKNDSAALGELEAVASSDRGINADLTLVAGYLARKDGAAALAAIHRLEKKQPDKPLATDLRGRVLSLRGDVPGARRAFEAALAKDPSFLPAVESLATLDLQAGKPELAEQRYASILKRDPGNAQALLALARLRTAAGKDRNEVVSLIDKAVAANPSAIAPRVAMVDFYLERKDAKLALEAAQSASGALPDSPDVLEALARAQLAAGNAEQAASSYAKLVALQPRSARLHVALASAYSAAKNETAAMRSLKQALALSPDFLPAQRQMIALDQALGNHDDALAIARAVQKKRPNAAAGYLYEGDVEAFQGHWAAAAAAYRTALTKEGGAGVAPRLHSALLAGGKSAEAATLANAWQQQHPKDAEFAFYLGSLALAAGDYPAAQERFQRVIELQPANGEAHNNLAWTLGQSKKHGAMDQVDIALRLRPDEAAFMDTKATLLAQENRWTEAIELERKALATEPGNSSRRLKLARFLVQAGDKASARRELERVMEAGEASPDFKAAQQLLGEI
jgi:putative PEP-CTERM system TPR-repeat lipoprotein